jgi:hypothetical protein
VGEKGCLEEQGMGGKRRAKADIKGFWGRGECHIWSSILGRRLKKK